MLKIFFIGFILSLTSASFAAKSIEGLRLLNQAILANDVSTVKQTLNLRVDVNQKSEQGVFAIHAAVKSNIKDEILSLLIKAGANPDVLDSSFETPLHVAITQGSVKKTKILLDAGANPNIQNRKRETALHLAAGGTGLKSDPKISHEMTLLILATQKADLKVRNNHDLSPLMVSVLRYTPSVQIVQALLDAGADRSLVALGPNKALDFAIGMLHFFQKNPSFGNDSVLEQEKIVNLLQADF